MKKALLLLVFVILALFLIVSCTTPKSSSSSTPPIAQEFTVDSNTMALWHFDEGSGTTVNDSAGNYPLYFQGSPTFASGKNGFKTCLSFSGSGESLVTSVSNQVPFKTGASGGLTVEFWINYSILPTGLNNYDILQTSDMNGLNLYLDSSGDINLFFYNYVDSSHITSFLVISTTPVPNDSNWHYVACTWDGATSTAYAYIDGAQAGSRTSSTFHPETEPCGGWYAAGIAGNACLNGKLDELRVLYVARSATDIQSYYNANK